MTPKNNKNTESAENIVSFDVNGTVEVIGVRFKSGPKVYYFSPDNIQFQVNDGVIVETIHGAEYATVTSANAEVMGTSVTSPLKRIIRKATQKDVDMMNYNTGRIKEVTRMCTERIAAHKLDMTIIDCDITFDGGHITFYFTTSDGNKVDFRDLLRDIVPMFRTRIELRQVSSRACMRADGCVGVCGRAVCCQSFLNKYPRVSIKMAKEQDLLIVQQKMMGMCGKLMCCLGYEHEAYTHMRSIMPHVGSKVVTPDGAGDVVSNNLMGEKTKVKLQRPDGSYEMREYRWRLLEYNTPNGVHYPEKDADDFAD